MPVSTLNCLSTLTKHISCFSGLRWLHWNFPGVLLGLESEGLGFGAVQSSHSTNVLSLEGSSSIWLWIGGQAIEGFPSWSCTAVLLNPERQAVGCGGDRAVAPHLFGAKHCPADSSLPLCREFPYLGPFLFKNLPNHHPAQTPDLTLYH